MNNILSRSKASKGTETYYQLETRINTLLQNYKVQATKIILYVTKFEVEQKKNRLTSAMNDSVSDLPNTLTILKIETKQCLTRLERR